MPAYSPVVGFDLDLTLLDTRARIIDSAVRGFAGLGVVIEPARVVPHLGYPLTHLAAELAPHVEVDAFVEGYRTHYRSTDAPPAPPMPGARAALEVVREAGGRTLAVSAKLDATIHESLAEAGLIDLIDDVHGGVFGVDKAVALIAARADAYVGDHLADIEAAHATPCLAVAVATGIYDEAALRASGADVVLPSLEAFPRWLASYAGPPESGA